MLRRIVPGLLIGSAVAILSWKMYIFVSYEQMPPRVSFIEGRVNGSLLLIRDTTRVVFYSKLRHVFRDTILTHENIFIPPGRLLSITPTSARCAATDGNISPSITLTP